MPHKRCCDKIGPRLPPEKLEDYDLARWEVLVKDTMTESQLQYPYNSYRRFPALSNSPQDRTVMVEVAAAANRYSKVFPFIPL